MWGLIERLSLFAISALGIKELIDVFTARKVNDNEIYTLRQTARLLKTNEEVLIKLIEDGRLKAQKVGDYYRVLGKSIKEFLEVEITRKKENTVNE